jgi:sec-independent protein translocase protein TatA
MPGNIGIPEIAIVLIIALLVFGPKRLPELGKSLGDGLREFKASISGDRDDDEPPEIDNGFEEEPAVEDEGPTPVAAARADAEAQTAEPSDRS